MLEGVGLRVTAVTSLKRAKRRILRINRCSIVQRKVNIGLVAAGRQSTSNLQVGSLFADWMGGKCFVGQLVEYPGMETSPGEYSSTEVSLHLI